MQIQVKAARQIKGGEELAALVEAIVARTLFHLSGLITRVEVHLTDENSHKGGGDDKRCVMEARLKRRQPVAVMYRAGNLIDAVDGAVEKLKASLNRIIGRVRATRRRRVADVTTPD